MFVPVSSSAFKVLVPNHLRIIQAKMPGAGNIIRACRQSCHFILNVGEELFKKEMTSFTQL